ncbi:histidine phosphatase family protein [Streptomyces sp. NPDC004647]|uniref:histidine phosphatase family protein n=1 Tax=Streptomyces sp. NPDC004647 TaxID=3154671 RepID=UPI0033B3E77C
MTVRMTLLAAAAGATRREVRFEDDAPLDERGLLRARQQAPSLPAVRQTYAAPSLRCRQTAEAMGLTAVTAPELAACSMGRWRGRTLDEVAAQEQEAVAAWLADPAAAPHGGESLLALRDRVGSWLDCRPAVEEGRVLVVADQTVIRAALVHALGLPPQTFWRLDVEPLAAVELSGRLGRWNLRLSPAGR